MNLRSARPQDWLALLVGIYAFLSPIWTTTTSKASSTMIVLGVLTALAALASIVWPGLVFGEGAMAILGVLFFISPWVMGFHSTVMGMAWTAWIVGAVTFALGLWSLPQSNRVHHGSGIAHQH